MREGLKRQERRSAVSARSRCIAAALSLPTGRTKDGLVVGTDLSAPLSPSGRQLDLTAQVDLPLLGGEISLAATHSRQPQHQRGAEGQWTFFTGYRANW